MPEATLIQAQVDPQLKNDVEEILKERGLSPTQALTLFFEQIQRKRDIPIDLYIPEDQSQTQNSLPTTYSFAPFPIDENRPLMEQNIQAYRTMHEDLVKSYLDQYVAIYDGQFVDHDPDPIALLQRIRTNYPNQVVLRRKVEVSSDRELRIRHPQIERIS